MTYFILQPKDYDICQNTLVRGFFLLPYRPVNFYFGNCLLSLWKRSKRPWPLWYIYYEPEKRQRQKNSLALSNTCRQDPRLLMLRVMLKASSVPLLEGQAPIPTDLLRIWFSRQDTFSALIWNGILKENQHQAEELLRCSDSKESVWSVFPGTPFFKKRKSWMG